MNTNRSVSYQPLNHSKPYKIKEHLSLLAYKIKIGMDENQILIDNINNLCINIHKSKQQLKKFTSLNNKANIENEFIKYITNLKTSNKNLGQQRRLLLQKYIKLNNKYNKELDPLNTELNILSDRKFIMENILNKKDFEIIKFTNEFNEIINVYIREEKREFLSNNLDMDEDLIIMDLDKKQALLLNKLKDYNRIFNKIRENKKNIGILKNIIEKVKKNNINSLTKEEEIIFFNNKKNLSKINLMDYQNMEELNSIEEDSILNDTINSEYDDEENIEFIPFINNYNPIKLKGKFIIPKLDLKQIDYNKRKFKQEDAEKSLSREIKEYDEDKLKIKELKNKIKRAKNKNKKYQEKCIKFEKKLKIMEKIIFNMEKYNYQLALSTRNMNINNNKHFSARGIGNNCGRQQMNAYSFRGRNSKFEGKFIENNNLENNDNNNGNDISL